MSPMDEMSVIFLRAVQRALEAGNMETIMRGVEQRIASDGSGRVAMELEMFLEYASAEALQDLFTPEEVDRMAELTALMEADGGLMVDEVMHGGRNVKH